MSPAASPVSNPRAATASDSRVAERIESLTECCVCLETFDELTRTPRILVCNALESGFVIPCEQLSDPLPLFGRRAGTPSARPA